MERHGRPLITLFWAEPAVAGAEVLIDGDAGHHARVRRAGTGTAVRLLDGLGSRADGTIVAAERNALRVRVDAVERVPRPRPLEVVAPVADRDRMLDAAEKCTELQVTSWRPAYFNRSRSVTPRGEGAKFRDKVLARMRAALEQSGGAWLPDVHEEAEAADVLAGIGSGCLRIMLDRSGGPMATLPLQSDIAIAVGPEGGLEPAELALARDSGWTLAALTETTLRFETAIIAATALVRCGQLVRGGA